MQEMLKGSGLKQYLFQPIQRQFAEKSHFYCLQSQTNIVFFWKVSHKKIGTVNKNRKTLSSKNVIPLRLLKIE